MRLHFGDYHDWHLHRLSTFQGNDNCNDLCALHVLIKWGMVRQSIVPTDLVHFGKGAGAIYCPSYNLGFQ